MEHKTLLIVGIVVALLASLACYIVCRVKLKRGEFFLVANGWDVAMLLVSAACCLILCLSPKNTMNLPKNEILVFACVGGAAFLGSVAMSVVHNWGSFGKIVLSVLAKVFVVLLSMLSIPVIALTSFFVSIIALIIRDIGLFQILKFKWLFKLIMGSRKSMMGSLLPVDEDDGLEAPSTLEKVD